MAMMDVTGPHYCPECQPVLNSKGRRIDRPLECSEANYSGCGVDMANCPKCGKGFQISFKVDKITRATTWDVSPEPKKESLQ